MRRSAIALIAILWMFTGSAASQQGTTVHRYVPDRYFNTFSFAHPPVLRIRPGDRVITSTIDAFGNDSEGRLVGARGNPQTGPFFVEGAEPGDMLVVMFHRIEPNRATAVSNTLLAAYALDPAFLRARGEREQRVDTWAIDKVRGVARTTSTDLIPGAIEVPLSPMLGCVATAPANKEAIRTTTPGPFGGNMDYIGVKPGATVMLPVNEPGALLFIGDGHAAQGHAELVGTGLETSMDVEFSVQLVKGKTIAWPRIEDERYLMVAGSERPLLQAFQHATTEMLSWLMTDYGYNERTASALLGVAAEYEIANVVDPHFTVVAKLPKANLPRR